MNSEEPVMEFLGLFVMPFLPVCPRCRKSHSDLEFSPLTNSREPGTSVAECPETKQPIIFKVVQPILSV